MRNKDLIGKTTRMHDRIEDMTVKITRTSGRFLFMGTGEGTVTIRFPVWFGERPIMSFGAEMDEDFEPVTANFPTWSATVTRWLKERQSPGFEGYYVGAVMAVVISGSGNQQTWLHWTAEGKAPRNPINPSEIGG